MDSLETLVIPPSMRDMQGTDTLLHDSGPATGNSRVLLFGTPESVAFLKDSEIWIADGTFKMTPPPLRASLHRPRLRPWLHHPVLLLLAAGQDPRHLRPRGPDLEQLAERSRRRDPPLGLRGRGSPGIRGPDCGVGRVLLPLPPGRPPAHPAVRPCHEVRRERGLPPPGCFLGGVVLPPGGGRAWCLRDVAGPLGFRDAGVASAVWAGGFGWVLATQCFKDS
eukprot:5056246-Alexandrium_andersonii.AAC.1